MDKGQQAFPLQVSISPTGDEHVAYEGMTLRDYFAAKAMAALIVKSTHSLEINSRIAYQHADAMLKARNA